jgi:2-methylcitrate dehydratase PrpD
MTVEDQLVDARTIARRLADYVTETKLADMPDDVLDYAKLVLLDSLICGLAAVDLERGRMVRSFAGRLGGPPDASVFGSSERVSSAGAVYANSDLMNLLDADETFMNSAHFAVIGIAAALAEAERLSSSGGELLRAVVLSFEVSARLNLATSLMQFEDGAFRWSPLSSHGYASFGAAAGAAVINGHTSDQLCSAFGLAAWTAPTAKNTNMAGRRRFNSFKYAPYGAIAQAGLTASMLADEGFRGDEDVLDIEPGFIRGQGYLQAFPDEMVRGFGSTWWILETSIKPYPSCRFTHAAIDTVIEFQRQNSIPVEDIEHVEVRLSPAAYASEFFRHPQRAIDDDHLAPFHGAFNIPFAMAAALRNVAAGPAWYDAKSLVDRSIWDLAERIDTAPDRALASEWQTVLAGGDGMKPRKTRGSLSIRVRGEEHVLESDNCAGDPWSEETHATWDLVADKCETFCSGLLDSEQRRQLIDLVRNLEHVDDVRESLGPLLRIDAR